MYHPLKIAFVVILISFPSCKNSSDRKSESTSVVNKQVLIGNWTRTDFEYRISISKINEDGTLAAQYFNPNQINVGEASWAESYGNLKIIIELRDVNYPGSTYTLSYLPDKDMLAGEYYQAVEGLTFYVEFTRIH
jgi:hypothetical protein